jgi:hypothetical protein
MGSGILIKKFDIPLGVSEITQFSRLSIHNALKKSRSVWSTKLLSNHEFNNELDYCLG